MRESRKQQNPRGGASVKLLAPSNREKIVFKLSTGENRLRFALVEIDVSKLDAAWRASGEGYISSDGTGAVKGRLDRFAAWLTSHPGEPIDAPWVYLHLGERVSFADGRHRFALLRDRGYRVLEIAVRKEQAATFRRFFSPKRP